MVRNVRLCCRWLFVRTASPRDSKRAGRKPKGSRSGNASHPLQMKPQGYHLSFFNDAVGKCDLSTEAAAGETGWYLFAQLNDGSGFICKGAKKSNTEITRKEGYELGPQQTKKRSTQRTSAQWQSRTGARPRGPAKARKRAWREAQPDPSEYWEKQRCSPSPRNQCLLRRSSVPQLLRS
jgi:hypothetical protein